ncbi:MAG: CBS domain-containing protein [Propionibacteriaceae bacterium]|nr:CBS domain-containing protein [Propionibacteriaceae bacterium]
MKVQDLVNRKGADVITIRSDETVAALVALLAQNNIGAAVVSDGDGWVHGIASERDVVRGLSESGAEILSQPVSVLMSRDVHTCQPTEDIASLAERMTTLRIRHLPVLQERQLAAIISIGDVVKGRLDQLTEERNQLISYVQG